MDNITVIIPAYNCEKYIPEAIDSVLKQTYQDFELIIVDDGSTDNTREIVKEYIGKNPNKIRYFYQENKGVSSARNKGIEESKGEFCAFLDDDDYFLPEFLEKCLIYLKKNDYDFIILKCYYRKIVDGEGNYKLLQYVRDDFPKNSQELYKILFKRFVGCVKMLVKKSCFEKHGSFDESITYVNDWDIWLQFAKAGLKAGLVPELKPLWVYRIRKDSVWHAASNRKVLLGDGYAVLQKHKKDAFNADLALKKVYGEKLWNIGKELFKHKKNRLFALKVLLESQICYLDFGKLFRSLSAGIKRIKSKISYEM